MDLRLAQRRPQRCPQRCSQRWLPHCPRCVGRHAQPHQQHQAMRGFTLVELVIVILLVAILSFTALPRLMERDDALAQGFAEQMAGTLRWAQKTAVAQRRLVYVNIDAAAGRMQACFDAAVACTQPLAAPGSGTLELNAPARVALTSAVQQFSFDAMGRPSLAANLELRATTAAGLSFAVMVEQDSGYVRRP